MATYLGNYIVLDITGNLSNHNLETATKLAMRIGLNVFRHSQTVPLIGNMIYTSSDIFCSVTQLAIKDYVLKHTVTLHLFYVIG